MKHKPGSMAKVYYEPKLTKGPDDPDRVETGEIPQVPETYAYLNAAYPVMNEHQLAIGETTFGGKRDLVSDKGIIDCPELYRLVLERAKTAREAIRIADELTRQYGYNDAGEAFTFADTKEVWIFEILGPGKGNKGAVWAAVRIPDDHVFVSANAPRIRKLNLADKDHYLASANVFSLAEQLGYWDPKSGEPFEFCTAYGSRTRHGQPAPRVARAQPHRAVAEARSERRALPAVGEGREEAVGEGRARHLPRHLPGHAVRHDAVAEQDRQGRQGDQEPDRQPVHERTTTSRRSTSSRNGPSPASARRTCTVTQSRGWLPNPIGGLVWLGYDNPMTTPHMPFYIGIAQMPASFMVDGRARFRRDCAWWAFRQASQLTTLRWQDMVKDVQRVWEPIEAKAFAEQAKVEEEALRLYKQDPAKAREYLTKYSHDIANGAVDAYWKLAEDLWTKYTNYFDRSGQGLQWSGVG